MNAFHTLALLGILATVVVAAMALGPVQADQPQTLAGNTNSFAIDLYKQLRSQEGNLFLSPYSVWTALTMTYAGARGDTAAEMHKVLHLPDDKEKLHPAVARIQQELTGKTKGMRLSVANALWGQKGMAFLPDFLGITRTWYNAGLHEVDYRQSEEARKEINAWVEKETQDKIRDLLTPGTITSDTRLVLTNAIYFKGDWQTAFPKKDTRKEDFHVTRDKTTSVDMMHLTSRFGYYEEEAFQALSMPYQGDAVSLVALLPKEDKSLSSLEESLSAEKMASLVQGMKPTKVIVSFPRFKLTVSFQLADVLAKLGMPTAFDVLRADFSGMTGSRDLFISRVVHKAFVDVNEEGTEAAAATGVVMATRAVLNPKPDPVFQADRPFLFALRDNRTGTLLFLGRVRNPNG